jgi:hypothetical protein
MATSYINYINLEKYHLKLINISLKFKAKMTKFRIETLLNIDLSIKFSDMTYQNFWGSIYLPSFIIDDLDTEIIIFYLIFINSFRSSIRNLYVLFTKSRS